MKLGFIKFQCSSPFFFKSESKKTNHQVARGHVFLYYPVWIRFCFLTQPMAKL